MNQDEDGFDESDTLTDRDLVVLVDEDGEETECVILAVVDHEGQDYAVLAPREQLQQSGEREEVELFLLEYHRDADGREIFAPIDDEERFESVRRMCADLVGTSEAGTPTFGGPVGEA
jgi:uncharacterized protein YrzB (UPF0473 family)